jgi:choline dehydrogenase
MLRSADPLDMPDITFNYFDTGSGDYEKDLEAITEAIGVARGAFDRQE